MADAKAGLEGVAEEDDCMRSAQRAPAEAMRYLGLVIPWETLRRLLGLPAEMGPMAPVELVDIALDSSKHIRLIASVLKDVTLPEASAAKVLGAVDRGKVEASDAVRLLGAIGHPAVYRWLLGRLHSDDADAAREAGVALVHLRGHAATEDLLVGLHLAAERAGREGAAWGLAHLQERTHVLSIARAAHDERIRIRWAVKCSLELPFITELWLEALENRGERARRLGTEMVYALLCRDDEESRHHLDELGRRGRDAVHRALHELNTYMLPDKRDLLELWLGVGEG